MSTSIMQNKADNDRVRSLSAISIHSYDSFNSITRAVKDQLYLNHIKVFDDINIQNIQNKQNIPYLDIINVAKKHIITSVYQDGIESEYQIILRIQAKLFFPSQINCFPINIQIRRTFIKNPEAILSNTIQENEILEDMYQDIAQKLIQTVLIKYTHNKKDL